MDRDRHRNRRGRYQGCALVTLKVAHTRHHWEPPVLVCGMPIKGGGIVRECGGSNGRSQGRPKNSVNNSPMLRDFADELKRVMRGNAGVRTRREVAADMRLSLACFDQRLYRARKLGWLPSGVDQGGTVFDPLGELGTSWRGKQPTPNRKLIEQGNRLYDRNGWTS